MKHTRLIPKAVLAGLCLLAAILVAQWSATRRSDERSGAPESKARRTTEHRVVRAAVQTVPPLALDLEPVEEAQVTACRERLEELVHGLEALRWPESQSLLDSLDELAAEGPEASQAMLEFLRAGEDFSLLDQRGVPLAAAPTLRIALLRVLEVHADARAMQAFWDTLLGSPVPMEVAVAAQAIPSSSWSRYRAEVLASLRRAMFLAPDPLVPDTLAKRLLLTVAVGSWRSEELLPEMEVAAVRDPLLLSVFFDGLAAFSAETQAKSLERSLALKGSSGLLTTVEMSERDLYELGEPVEQLARLSIQNPSIQSTLESLFPEMTRTQKMKFVSRLAPRQFHDVPRLSAGITLMQSVLEGEQDPTLRDLCERMIDRHKESLERLNTL